MVEEEEEEEVLVVWGVAILLVGLNGWFSNTYSKKLFISI